MKCNTEFRWPKSYFPAHLCVVDEKNGEEKHFDLVMKAGVLTVHVKAFGPSAESESGPGPSEVGATATDQP